MQLFSSARCSVNSLPLWFPGTLSPINSTQEVLRFPLPASWLENSLKTISSICCSRHLFPISLELLTFTSWCPVSFLFFFNLGGQESKSGPCYSILALNSIFCLCVRSNWGTTTDVVGFHFLCFQIVTFFRVYI